MKTDKTKKLRPLIISIIIGAVCLLWVNNFSLITGINHHQNWRIVVAIIADILMVAVAVMLTRLVIIKKRNTAKQ